MANKVLFYRGLYKNYDSATMTGVIYFATDTGEIWIDGKRYGNDNQQVVQDVTLSDGNLVITYNTYTESIPDAVTIPVADFMANLSEATPESAGLMSAEDKAALDALKNTSGLSVVVENSLTSTSVDNALSAYQGKVLKDMIDALPAYEIEKTESGYKLVTETGGEALGEVISFSDLVVKSGEVVDVDGSLYIRLTLTNDEVIDIPAVSLVDVYTAGDSYINVSDDNKISLNVDILKSDLKIPEDLSEEVAELITTVGNAEFGLVKSVNENEYQIKNLETAVSGKADQSALNALEEVISSNTSSVQALETAVGENTEKIEILDGKVDVSKVSTAIAEAIAPFRIKGLVAGENIEIVETNDPGIFKIGVTNIAAEDILYEEGISVKDKLDTLSDAIDAAGNGGLLGITGGPGISVSTSASTTIPTIGIKVKEDSALVVDEDGLDIIWKEFLS